MDKLFERQVSSVSLDRTVSTAALLSAFDVDHVGTEALLFQTGYLTITGEERLGGKPLYRLGYPNREVRQSLNEHLLGHLVQDAERQTANSVRLARLLAAHDCAGLQELFRAFFASIPYEWHTSNDIANYYASVFYSYFAALGYEIAVEESSSHGRLDMAVRTGGHVYLFEFKVVEQSPPGSALAQLRERDYAAKYRGGGEPIHLIGVEFSRETRNVTAFEWPTADTSRTGSGTATSTRAGGFGRLDGYLLNAVPDQQAAVPDAAPARDGRGYWIHDGRLWVSGHLRWAAHVVGVRHADEGALTVREAEVVAPQGIARPIGEPGAATAGRDWRRCAGPCRHGEAGNNVVGVDTLPAPILVRSRHARRTREGGTESCEERGHC